MAKYQVSRIANPRKKNSLLAALGAGNPNKEKSKMAKKAKKHHKKGGHGKKRNSTFIFSGSRPAAKSAVGTKSNKRHKSGRRHGRKRNPMDITLGGQRVPVQEVFKLLIGLLCGVAGTKVATPYVPLDMSSTPTKVIASGGVGYVTGKVAESFDRTFGYGWQLGALAHTLSLALNFIVPSVGSKLSLQGGRGMGRRGVGQYIDIAPPYPQNQFAQSSVMAALPATTAETVDAAMESVYPSAYMN